MRFWNWLRSKFIPSQPQADEVAPLYSEEEQGIFSYFDGKQLVRADPMVLHRRLAAYGADLEIDLQVADSPMKDAPAALQKALKKIRDAFELPAPTNDLKAPDEGCLTEAGVLVVFNRFIAFCNDIKKNWRPLQTPPAAEPIASLSSTAENPHTPNTSDSGSTANESSTDSPGPSATESASAPDQ